MYTRKKTIYENINRKEVEGGNNRTDGRLTMTWLKSHRLKSNLFLQVRMIRVRHLTDHMRSHICSNWIMAINIPFFFFLSGCVSDQRSSCPHSLNHTTSCCTAPGPTLMSSFSFFEEKKKGGGGNLIATVSQSSMSIHHRVAFLLFFLIMKPLSIYTVKRVRPGTSAACEGDETKKRDHERRGRGQL